MKTNSKEFHDAVKELAAKYQQEEGEVLKLINALHERGTKDSDLFSETEKCLEYIKSVNEEADDE